MINLGAICFLTMSETLPSAHAIDLHLSGVHPVICDRYAGNRSGDKHHWGCLRSGCAINLSHAGSL